MSVAAAAPSASSDIKVMIVDDSVVVRGLVSRWLSELAGFSVVATASNGKQALDMLERVEPDIILLDIEMPELDGLSALPQLLKKCPRASVIMISTLTRRNAEVSLKALSLGATDYLAKPDSHREVTTSMGFRKELIDKLQALGQKRKPGLAVKGPSSTLDLPKPKLPSNAGVRSSVTPRALVIGSSTGGPRAVGQVLTSLGKTIEKLPVLIVQHMPPIFTSVFADHLKSQTGFNAHEAKDGEVVTPGHIYVAPGGKHMGLAKSGAQIVIRLNDGPPENFCKPAVDVLFREAAQVYGASALGIILTGMGSDGTIGAKPLVDAGAVMLAQDEATSTVWGMPGSLVRAGLASAVLPLDAIGPAAGTLIAGRSL